MTYEAIEVTYCGRPAGSGAITDHEDGACFVWTRPDGVSEFRSFSDRDTAGKALADRINAWYEGLQ